MHLATHTSDRRLALRSSLRLFSALLALACAVHGTKASGQGLTASLIISDDSGAPSVNLDLSGWVTFNQPTGQYALVQPGTSFGSSGWRWAQNATVPVPGTGESATQTVMRWADESRATVSILDLAGKIDPMMTYSLAVKNNTAFTQTYTFVFGEAMVPAFSGPYTVFADVGVTLSTSTPVATIAPVGAAPKFQVLSLSDDGGATSFNAGVDVGGAYSRTTNGTGFFTEASAVVTGTTPLNLNYWLFTTSFTLTPGGDAVGISGFAEITPIPEPAAFALLAGCAVLAGVRLRRKTWKRTATAVT
jgi:hypothetical protein